MSFGGCEVGFVGVMWCCTACCMQDWQESPLCPSPAASDFSKDIPATCILLNVTSASATIYPCLNAFVLYHSVFSEGYTLLFCAPSAVFDRTLNIYLKKQSITVLVCHFHLSPFCFLHIHASLNCPPF